MRDYDPTTGRYLQADPLGLVDGPSVYGYVGQSPLGMIDPDGLYQRPCPKHDFICRNNQLLEGAGSSGGPKGGKPLSLSDVGRLCKAGLAALVEMLYPGQACAGDCPKDEKCEKHHPHPRALGGPRVQTVVSMTRSDHVVGPASIHSIMNARLRKNCVKCVDGESRDASPRRGNSGLDIQGYFSDEEVLACLARFYREHQNLWPDVANAFFKDYPGL